MEDVRKLLPKDKFDLSTTEELMQLDDDEIEAIIPDLLIWIQDIPRQLLQLIPAFHPL